MKDSSFELNISKETTHFKLYFAENDRECILDLSNELESNYDRVSNDLQSYLRNKVEVKIYPDLKTFHEFGWGQKDSPDWLVGTAMFGDIRIVSPLNPGTFHSYSGIMKTIVHEFTHILIDSIKVGNVYRWLHEGVASYEAKQMNDQQRKFISKRIQLEQIPTFDDFSRSFEETGGYEFSYTMVEFIIKEFGMQKVRELIKNSTDIEKVLVLSKDEFRMKWRYFLKENYEKVK